MRNVLSCVLACSSVALPATAQLAPLPASRMAHTYSIVARDPATGEIGVAVQSHWFGVGSLVAWAEAGVGAVATQSLVDPAYGPLGLTLMRSGKSPEEALKALTAGDPTPAIRQVAMLDVKGRVAAHTGEGCIAAAGHVVGEGFSVQANLMRSDAIWPAMAKAFRESRGSLAERMLAALDAAEAAGGDIRGRQSAALKVVSGASTGRPWVDTIHDLRVDDHPEPLKELRRLVRLQTAYRHAGHGDDLMGEKRVDEALVAYREAARIAPEIEELPFWTAVTLAGIGRVDEALPIFAETFAKNADYRTLVPRLAKAGLLPDDPALLERIAAVGGKQGK